MPKNGSTSEIAEIKKSFDFSKNACKNEKFTLYKKKNVKGALHHTFGLRHEGVNNSRLKMGKKWWTHCITNIFNTQKPQNLLWNKSLLEDINI